MTRTIVASLIAALLLSACGGLQTGRALNAFDSDTFWCTWDECSKSGSGNDSSQPDASGPGDGGVVGH